MRGNWKIIGLVALTMVATPIARNIAQSIRASSAQPPATTAAPMPAAPQSAPTYSETGDTSAGAVYPGTSGAAAQPIPAYRAGTTFAIMGDAAPPNDATPGYLRQAVEELNRLRPDLVLTTGNQIAGYTRSVDEYIAEATAYRKTMAALQMPAYFCAGDHDVESGTRDRGDRRFEKLYEKAFGPLYYSLDFRDIHIITLYTEGSLTGSPTISDVQMAWLEQDLNRTFDNHKIAHVFIILHRPLWQLPTSNWDKVHRKLLAFNRRPLVTVEGYPDNLPASAVPRIEAVFAGHEGAFSQEPPRDGINYYVLGPLGACVDGDAAAGRMQHYTFIHTDTSGVHVAEIRPGNVLPDDFVIAKDRDILWKIAAFDEKTMGIDGILEQPAGRAVGVQDANSGQLVQVLSNPLDVPIDVSFRMASLSNLVTAESKIASNPYVDTYDSPWELYVPYGSKHLEPGEKVRYRMSLFSMPRFEELPPPQVEFVVTYLDSKGRSVPTVLKRRVPVIPSAAIPLLKGALTAEAWDDAVHANTYSWIPNPNDKPQPSPEFAMLADAGSLYIRVQVQGKTVPTYFHKLDRPWDLPCDAISVAWAPTANTANKKVQRIVVLWPSPPRAQILINTGVGVQQTPLLPYEGADQVTAMLSSQDDEYHVVLMLPRAMVLPTGTGVLNVTVTNNDGGAVSTWRSWAREDLGPKAWGKIRISGEDKR